MTLPLNHAYIAAFDAISNDNKKLFVVGLIDKVVVGTLQLSFILGLTHQGAWRGQIEAVRIHESHRNSGLGRELFEWAIARCRERNCEIIQLNSEKSRPEAHRFYEQLGYVSTHMGYKLKI